MFNSNNKRDSSLLNSSLIAPVRTNFLEGKVAFSRTRRGLEVGHFNEISAGWDFKEFLSNYTCISYDHEGD